MLLNGASKKKEREREETLVAKYAPSEQPTLHSIRHDARGCAITTKETKYKQLVTLPHDWQKKNLNLLLSTLAHQNAPSTTKITVKTTDASNHRLSCYQPHRELQHF